MTFSSWDVSLCVWMSAHNDWRQVQVLPVEPWALCGRVWPSSPVSPRRARAEERCEVVLFSLLAASEPIPP